MSIRSSRKPNGSINSSKDKMSAKPNDGLASKKNDENVLNWPDIDKDDNIVTHAGTSKSRNLVNIHQVIDLTDKPIRLRRQEIGWSRVRSNASNCICCCCNNSITLVTTNESYVLDHVPLEHIDCAQASHNLQYLAISNSSKLAIIELVNQGDDLRGEDCLHAEGMRTNSCRNEWPREHEQPTTSRKETKYVNLASNRLTMADVLFWRWLDETTLAILTSDTLYTCSLDQTQISHPAMSAMSFKCQLLAMEKVCVVDEKINNLCQVTDIQRDHSMNFYAISGLYDTDSTTLPVSRSRDVGLSSPPGSASSQSTIRPSFGSVPSRLSQLVNNDHSFDSLISEPLLENSSQKRKAYCNLESSTNCSNQRTASSLVANSGYDAIQGLVQIHCRARDCSQLITAHAVTFTTQVIERSSSINKLDEVERTVLIAASKLVDRLRVHFVAMAKSGQNHISAKLSRGHSSPWIEFDSEGGRDLPTSIVCSRYEPISDGGDGLHIVMITTKFGQLIVGDVKHETLLFTMRITADIVCQVVHESKTNGLMVICRNGQVLLVELEYKRLRQLRNECKRKLRPMSFCQSFLYKSLDYNTHTANSLSSTNTMANWRNSSHNNLDSFSCPRSKISQLNNVGDEHQKHSLLDIDLEVLISTKL